MDDAVAELGAEVAAPDEEEFVFVVVMVPGEGALDLNEFELLVVEGGDGFGTPVAGERANLLVRVTRFMEHEMSTEL